MKPAQGFLSSDGQFFTDEIDAELHEASNELDEAVILAGVMTQLPGRMRNALDRMLPEVERYVNARKAKDIAVARTAGTADISREDNRGGEEDAATVLEQQTGEHQLVSDLRSGIGTEEVSNVGSLDGIGGGGGDAQGVRRDPDMATDVRAETAKARTSNRKPNIRT